MNIARIIFFIILVAGLFTFLLAPGVGTVAYIGAALCVVGLLGSLIFTIPQLKKIRAELSQADAELKEVAEKFEQKAKKR